MTLFEKVFDKTIPALTKGLDLYWGRNKAINSNIANAETPGYRAVDLRFAGELERAFHQASAGEMKKSSPLHMDVSSHERAHFVADYSGMVKADGNNVDIDLQMGKLIDNSGKYSLGTNLVRKKLFILRNAIRELMR